MDLDPYFSFPVKTDWEEIKLTELGMITGLCWHPILLGKVLPGTAPSAEQRRGSCSDGNIPPHGYAYLTAPMGKESSLVQASSSKPCW